MGIDLLNVLLEVENRFQVQFTDEELNRCATVGDLYELLLRDLEISDVSVGVPHAPCKTSRAFWRLRKSLMEQFGVSRSSVTPGASIADLIPREDRRAQWAALSRALEMKLPRLGRPGWVVWMFLPVAMLGAVVARHWLPSDQALVCGVAAMLFFADATVPLATEVSFATAGDMATWIAAHSRNVPHPVPARWTKGEVWTELVRVIVEQQGLDPAMITPEASWVDDLGIC